jgi:hypothetical protein
MKFDGLVDWRDDGRRIWDEKESAIVVGMGTMGVELLVEDVKVSRESLRENVRSDHIRFVPEFGLFRDWIDTFGMHTVFFVLYSSSTLEALSTS